MNGQADNIPKPARPLLIWDGECGFCRFWIMRWQTLTCGQVDYEPYQSAAARFPAIPIEQFKRSVVHVAPDGTIRAGAHAVLTTLAAARHRRWLLTLYERIAPFRIAAEWLYRIVANNRAFLSKLTRLIWGEYDESAKR
ncbi:MAG TPA: DCC1-like thiol-disulfide oxidoreductase family protein [candidate division Zixibacteria bacterium]